MNGADPGSDPDAALLSQVAKRDAGATREMVARKLPRLLSLATRLLGDRDEARDVAQDAFLRIWSEAPRWQSGSAKFDTWLHRVVLNLCYDRLRKSRRQDPRPFDALPEAEIEGSESTFASPPETKMLEQARQARVQAAIAALPPRQREALVLQYYQDLSNIDAAETLGISVEALESLLSRARRALRDELADERSGIVPAPDGIAKKRGSDRTGNERSGDEP